MRFFWKGFAIEDIRSAECCHLAGAICPGWTCDALGHWVDVVVLEDVALLEAAAKLKEYTEPGEGRGPRAKDFSSLDHHGFDDDPGYMQATSGNVQFPNVAEVCSTGIVTCG